MMGKKPGKGLAMNGIGLVGKKGFSLIEVLVGILLLGIIIVAFTPLFTQMLQMISLAGDRSVELFESSGEMDRKRADLIVLKGGEMELEFPGMDPISVQGGIIEEDDFLTFVTNVPTISLDPYRIHEGYSLDTYIDVLGQNTSFAQNSSVTIIDRYGVDNSSCYNASLQNVENETEAQIRLTGYLKNAHSPYIVTIENEDTGLGTEYARAKLEVSLPKAMLVAEEGVFVSAGELDQWIGAVDYYSLPSPMEGFSVAFGNRGYVVVGPEEIYRLEDGREWETIHGVTDSPLHQVRRLKWTFYAVGQSGEMYYSQNGWTWNTVDDEGLDAIPDRENLQLNDISLATLDESDIMVLVGEYNGGGIIVYHNLDDGVLEHETIDYPLQSIAYGDDGESVQHFVAVGEDGVLYYSETGEKESWTQKKTEDAHTLHSVIWTGTGKAFFAAGEKGQIVKLSYDDGENTWQLNEELNRDFPDDEENYTFHSLSRFMGNTLIATGQREDNGDMKGILYVSRDSGESWDEEIEFNTTGPIYDLCFW